jgi:arylsulfatase A-like enzyme
MMHNTSRSGRHPNILWLVTDHVPYMHHGALPGPHPTYGTYERIAREGISFPQAMTVCPLCQPARASMLTGLYPHHHGMVHNSGFAGSRKEFEPDTKLFSHYLREAGYQVGYFGKWHCGIERTADNYGFQGWSLPDYGHPYHHPEYKEYLERYGLPEAMVDVEGCFGADHLRARGIRLTDEPNEYHRMSAWGVMTSPVQSHEAWFVCDMAARWLEQVASRREPFALRVDVWGPHQPYWAAGPFSGTVDPATIPEYPNFRHDLRDRPQFQRATRDAQHRDPKWDDWQNWQPMLARCYENASQVDASFGGLLDLLDRHGLAENTMVIYTADHGDGIGSHGGLFDKGSFMVEETMRIPLAVRWPGQIPANYVSSRLVTNMDLVPTVLEAAGAELPDMDGASVLALAKDRSNTQWREDLLCQHYGHGQNAFQRLLRHGKYKYIAHLNDVEELYDLSSDPFELHNLASARPSPDVTARMRERLAAAMERHQDSDPKAAALLRQISASG